LLTLVSPAHEEKTSAVSPGGLELAGLRDELRDRETGDGDGSVVKDRPYPT
jgi:hypothetical protein